MFHYSAQKFTLNSSTIKITAENRLASFSQAVWLQSCAVLLQETVFASVDNYKQIHTQAGLA